MQHVALELWILLALAAAGAILWAVGRSRRKRRVETPPAERNVYPLW